ncbi:MAG: hypothetical protein K9L62_00275 [Vallitaleaceae bacterium]|nr:hypothetical protein [Vallitaleaceae bacterium]
MNIKETATMMMILETAYPRFYADKSEEEKKTAIKLWTTMFENDPAEVVIEAVKSLICSLKFPPTIADVKEKIYLITQPQSMTEMEAWNKVLAAIKDSGYHAKERFDSLPPIIQKIIGSPSQLREWGLMDSDTVNSVIQSNFMRSYTARSRQEKEILMLPDSTRALIQGLSEKMALGDGRALQGGVKTDEEKDVHKHMRNR